MPVVATGEIVQGDDRLPLLPPGEMGLGDDPAETGVALGIPGQHDQVGAVGVRHPGTDMGESVPGDGELGAEDGGQPEGPGRLGEADHTVETVVVGQGQRGQTEPDGPRGQLLGMAGPVEKGEVGMGVEFGIGHRRGPVTRRSLRPTSGPVRPAADGRQAQ